MLNLPNLLAFLRMLLAPLLFFILSCHPTSMDLSWQEYFAALVFSIAALSDFFDGFIARAWDQHTKLGAIIDPLADKMLILASFLGLLLMGRVNEWIIYIILVREFFITGFRVLLSSQNLSIQPSFAGKAKTSVQLLAVLLLIMRWPLANSMLYLALFLTLYSAFEYVYKYAKLSKDIEI